ncbi:hypothetical protein BH11GEM1_BH11GEM1_06900 [soil metagenome]
MRTPLSAVLLLVADTSASSSSRHMRHSSGTALPASRPMIFLALVIALLSAGQRADAQVRERPVAFDSAGRVTAVTPPLAARLGLSAPLWPVSGDYLDARLYALDDAGEAYVLVVRRQREVLERYSIDAATRRELAKAIATGTATDLARGGPDAVPTFISEPVRGYFVLNQTLLGAILFGPAASTLVDDPAGGAAAYLAVTGGMFFLSANMTTGNSVSRAQNHLSWHSARRGAIAADLLLYSVTGNDDGRDYAAATLLGGIAGDVIGFKLAEPMTDAEAHGTSHGSTVTAALALGLMGSGGMFDNDASARVGTAAIVGAGALGYPLGLRYVRSAPYRVTAGDVGTLVTTEFLAMAAAATLLPNHASDKVVYAALTSAFALGAIAGDRLLVRPYDHTEAESRLVQYGAGAGALVALAVPVLAQSSNTQLIFGAATIGGVLGTLLTEQLITPQAAGSGLGMLPGSEPAVGKSTGANLRFSPESALMAGLGLKGNHSIVSLTF